MELKTGSRWRSAVCDTEVIVVRAPTTPVTIECGGRAMLPHDADRDPELTPDGAWAGGTPLGKRFADPSSGIELLATKGGDGTLAVDGVPLPLKAAKPLPASD